MTEENERKISKILDVSRRDVMKAAGASVVGAGALTGTAAANHCDGACADATSGPSQCAACLPSDCQFVAQRSPGADPPEEDWTHKIVKASTQCFEDSVPSDCPHEVSHVEYYNCPCPYSGIGVCLDEFSCCRVAGAVTGLSADTCEATVTITYDGCSDYTETVSGSDPSFSNTTGCECTPTSVTVTDPEGNQIASFTPSTALNCSASVGGC